jgi:hypothetical protein
MNYELPAAADWLNKKVKAESRSINSAGQRLAETEYASGHKP